MWVFEETFSSDSKNCFVGVAKIAFLSFESQKNITSCLLNEVNIENENVR